MMIRLSMAIAFCAGLALAWCGIAEAEPQCPEYMPCGQAGAYSAIYIGSQTIVDEHCSVLDPKHTPNTPDCIETPSPPGFDLDILIVSFGIGAIGGMIAVLIVAMMA
jgi:hypothetical protein